AGRGRNADHAGAAEGRLDHGGRPGSAARRADAERADHGAGLRISARMLARTHHDTLDSGPRRTAPGGERFCAATGEVKPVADLIRFVVAPDGAVVADLKRRLPGRGLWITATRQALDMAIARKAFARGFKRDVRVSAELVETTERLIEQAALDALAMS